MEEPPYFRIANPWHSSFWPVTCINEIELLKKNTIKRTFQDFTRRQGPSYLPDFPLAKTSLSGLVFLRNAEIEIPSALVVTDKRS